MLHEGNVVRSSGTNDSTLLVINQIQPIYVSFTVPQQQLSAVKTYMQAGSLGVEALPAGDKRPERGVVTFVDNAIDPTTGTVRLKATFPNTERRLWPGQFANVTLTLTVDPNALVVPSQAVQAGTQGSFVFVVKPDSTVENRRVVVARTQGSDSVITTGLQAGEQVVTDGQPRLTPGAKVEVRGAPASGRAGGPGGRPPDGKAAPAEGKGAPAEVKTAPAEGKAAPAEGKSAAPDAKPGTPPGKAAVPDAKPAVPEGKPKA
jgi:multidrug efflux system membrane fusion protein